MFSDPCNWRKIQVSDLKSKTTPTLPSTWIDEEDYGTLSYLQKALTTHFHYFKEVENPISIQRNDSNFSTTTS